MVKRYIFLASGCVSVGIVVTLVVLAVCQRFDVNIDKNLWVLAIPAAFSLILNVSILEVYQAYRRRHT